MKRTSPIAKPDRESVLEVAKLTNAEARFLVSNYYDAQDARKREDMQLRHLGDNPEQAVTRFLKWTADANAEIEGQVKRALEKFAEGSRVGRWCLAQHGLGPVITAGLLAHLDIERAPTAGHFWRFAGLDPTCKWEKGQKRPFNRALKQLMFHLGECFKRSSNSPDSIYGKLYRERKAMIVARNERGFNAERAKTFTTKSADVRKTLAEGKLPAGNLDRQACNYAAKIFLSHLHALMFWDKFGTVPPKPFAIAIMGHAHEIVVPMTDEHFPGFAESYTASIAD
jgi:hypothetical protein